MDFEYFYLNTKAAIFQYLYQHIADHEEAEDVAQEAYLRALEEWEEVRNHPNPTGWLMQTAKNILIGFHRHTYSRKYSFDELEELVYEEPAFDMLVMEDLFENIYSPKERALAQKYFVEGNTIEEMAEEMGVSEGAFRSRMYRIKKKLLDYVEEHEIV